MELRQFVYLDDLAVRSLLASLGMPPATEIQETFESTDEAEGDISFGGKLEIPKVAHLSGDVGVAGTAGESSAVQTQRRINSQFLFDSLHEKLKKENNIQKIDERSDINIKQGDVVKIKTTMQTDAIFRFIKIISLFEKISGKNLTDNKEQVEVINEIYSNNIGISMKGLETKISFVSSLSVENLWIDPERLFTGQKSYTILGRVGDKYGNKESWDYIDIARIADTIVSDETMENLREAVSNTLSLVNQAEGEFSLPNIENQNIDSFDELSSINSDANQISSVLSLDIDESDISVNGPAYEIEPIGIYW